MIFKNIKQYAMLYLFKHYISKSSIYSGIGFVCFILILLFQGCYYDSKEYLYPNTTCTDTVAPVKYSGAITSIISQYCISCHDGSNSTSKISLLTYKDVLIQVQNQNLYHCIIQDGVVASMPQNGKLDDCQIKAINIWLNDSAKNN